MRVFVLGTGRCGTTTFARACAHLTNFTSGHETNVKQIGDARFAYPDQHIEVDNRLSWFLGELGRRFPGARYVHLRRDREQVVDSFLHRWNTKSIISAFGHQLVMHSADWPADERRDVCRFYVDTVTANLEEFLAQRRSMTIWLTRRGHRVPDLAGLDRRRGGSRRGHRRVGGPAQREPPPSGPHAAARVKFSEAGWLGFR